MQDVMNLGRLAQILEFLGKEGDKVDRDLTKALTRMSRDLKQLATALGADQACILRGEDPTCTIQYGMYVLAGQEYVQYAADTWGNHFIRRNTRSRAWDGSPNMQGVPPLTIVDTYTEMSKVELGEMDKAVMRVEER